MVATVRRIEYQYIVDTKQFEKALKQMKITMNTVEKQINVDTEQMENSFETMENSIKRDTKQVSTSNKKMSNSIERSTEKSERSIEELERQTKKSSKGMKNSMSSFGKFMSVGLVSMVGRASIQVGIQVETMEKQVKASFGEMSGVVEEWAKTMSEQLGVSETALKQNSAMVANTAKNYGMAEDEANLYGVAVTQLSAIFATYLGLPIEETQDRISSAMRGEAESAKALNLALDQTAVMAYASANGLDVQWASLSASEKMMWRFYTALSQTATMGGYANTEINTQAEALEFLEWATEETTLDITTLGGAMSLLKTQMKDVLRIIAPVFIPILIILGLAFKIVESIIKGLIIVIKKVAQTIMEAIPPSVSFTEVMEKIKQVITTLLPIFIRMAEVIGVVIGKIIIFALTSDILRAMVQGIIGVIQALIPLLQTIIEVLKPIIELLLKIIHVVMPPLFTVFYELIEIIIRLVDIILMMLKPVLDILINILSVILIPILWILVGAIEGVILVISWWVERIANLIHFIKDIIEWIKNWFLELEMVQGIIESVSNAMETLEGWIDSGIEAVKGLIEAWQEFFTLPWNKAQEDISGASTPPSGKGIGSQIAGIVKRMQTQMEGIMSMTTSTFKGVSGGDTSISQMQGTQGGTGTVDNSTTNKNNISINNSFEGYISEIDIYNATEKARRSAIRKANGGI